MDKNDISKNKKYLLGYLAGLSFFSFLWVATLLLYLFFRVFFGNEPDFYHLIVLAGMVGGLWGHGTTILVQIIRNSRTGMTYHTEKSFRKNLLFFIVVLTVATIFSTNFGTILTYFNLN